MNKFQFHTDASIGFFLVINPKLVLRKVLKEKIDEICTWLNLDDDDTKALVKEKMSNHTLIQEIVIPAYDIHNNVFESGIGEDCITTTVDEIRTSPEHVPILKSILRKASHPDNYPTIQFILYCIQGITNKEIYETIIKKQNSFIQDRSIIPMYNIEEEEITKCAQLIESK